MQNRKPYYQPRHFLHNARAARPQWRLEAFAEQGPRHLYSCRCHRNPAKGYSPLSTEGEDPFLKKKTTQSWSVTIFEHCDSLQTLTAIGMVVRRSSLSRREPSGLLPLEASKMRSYSIVEAAPLSSSTFSVQRLVSFLASLCCNSQH